jgi:hypothetical protein
MEAICFSETSFAQNLHGALSQKTEFFIDMLTGLMLDGFTKKHHSLFGNSTAHLLEGMDSNTSNFMSWTHVSVLMVLKREEICRTDLPSQE